MWQIYGRSNTRALIEAKSILLRTPPGAHVTRDGLQEIAELAAQMNPSGKRKYLPAMIAMSFNEMKA